ncbi:MAG: YheU family protein [Gammaproteobacteria bacterium]|nr:YheU family protein [Gammaproteobacteria bacterium]
MREVGAQFTVAPWSTSILIRISLVELSEEALNGIVESFVLREGTDYGFKEVSFEEKCAAVLLQLERSEAEIWFDPESQSTDIRLTGE